MQRRTLYDDGTWMWIHFLSPVLCSIGDFNIVRNSMKAEFNYISVDRVPARGCMDCGRAEK